MVQVSIIVPVYNVDEYLEKCIQSILNQSYNNFELILINDGSSDSSLEICNKYKVKDNRIKIINQTNQGVGVARNNGLNLAKGKYVYFCDADDFIENDLLLDNVNLAEEYDANMVIFGNKEVFTDLTKYLTYKTNYYSSATEFRSIFSELFRNHNMHVLWNKLYKRCYIEEKEIRFSTRTLGEDSLFNKQIYSDLEKVFVNSKIYYSHLNRFGSAQNSFKVDRFNLRLKETAELEALIKSWGMIENEKDLIINDWLKTLFIGLENIFHKDNISNFNVQRESIANIVGVNSIMWALNEDSFSNSRGVFKRCIILMLRIRLFSLVVLAFKFKNKFKKIINKRR